MKKTLSTILFLSSVSSFANCIVELQYQNTVLGQNIFQSNICTDAMRDCKRTQKMYERTHMLPANELQCVKFDSNTGPIPTDPTGPSYPDPTPNDPTGGVGSDPNPMSRYEALRALEDAEGDAQQGEENFDLIMSYVRNGDIFLRDGVDSFNKILRYLGSNNTSSARILFKESMALSARQFLTAKDASDLIIKNIKVEGDVTQGLDNVKLAENYTDGNIGSSDIYMVNDEFIRVLKRLGINNTDSARLYFKAIATGRQLGQSLAREIDFSFRILDIEANTDQTLENMVLANKAANLSGVSMNEAVNTIIDLLNRYGSNNTTTVQQKFKKIYRL